MNEIDPNSIVIREAHGADGPELQAMQAASPQGTGLRFTVRNEPDFFDRVRVYRRAKVLVAEAGGRLLGSAAWALKHVRIDGGETLVGYEFGYMTHPDARRMGIALRIHREIEEHLRAAGAQYTYLVIAEENTPSINLFRGDGFQLRDPALRISHLLVWRPQSPTAGLRWRIATEADLPAAAKLINRTWRFHQFTPAYTITGLRHLIGEAPGMRPEQFWIGEKDGEPRVCVGWWDMRRVTRVTILELGRRLQTLNLVTRALGLFTPLPNVPGPGKTLEQWVIGPLGYVAPKYIPAALSMVNNRALREGVDQLDLIHLPGDALARAIRTRLHAAMTLEFGVKPLVEGLKVPTGPVHIPAIDL